MSCTFAQITLNIFHFQLENNVVIMWFSSYFCATETSELFLARHLILEEVNSKIFGILSTEINIHVGLQKQSSGTWYKQESWGILSSSEGN